MAHWTGYLKGISVLFFLLPFIIIQFNDEIEEHGKVTADNMNKKVIIRNNTAIRIKLLVIFLFIAMLVGGYFIDHWNRDCLLSNYLYWTPLTNEDAEELVDYSCELEIQTFDFEKYSKLPTQVVDDYAICDVYIKNNSNQIWSNQGDSSGCKCVVISYQIFKDGEIVREGDRFKLLSSLEPGETMNREIYIDYPNEAGTYTVKVGLLQEGSSWFYSMGTGYQDVEIEVK